MSRLLSIVIPVYNASQTVARTLRSLEIIAPRRRPLVEVVAVDDGSTDDSPAVFERSAAALDGLQCNIVTQTNQGVSVARNAAIERAQGDWILFLDADDELIFDPVERLREPNDATSILWPVEMSPQDRRPTVARFRPMAPDSFLDRVTAENPYPICALTVRRSALVERFDSEMRYLEDWDFWLRNPNVFERMATEAGAALTRVHVHQQNRSSHWAACGAARCRIASAAR
ncbi:MAG: glycosyltransferase family 2 protein, partial [Planctomycetales bacterium]|nr:glycosyltransferase family 2 protein [Planctomycetales bacterium]